MRETPATRAVGPVAAEPRSRPLSLLLRAALVALAASLLAVAGFTVWTLNPYRADEMAIDALRSNGQVTVSDARAWIAFEPADAHRGVGLVLYPGGRVEAEAYAPLARRLAEDGYFVAICRMPFNLAVFGIERADRVIETRPDVTTWVVGGHSLGGAMAAEYTSRRPGVVDGVLLLGAYPGSGVDLTARDITALTIHASEDGLVDSGDLAAGRSRLPAGARLVEISGGNHAGFGSYGPQRGDGETALPPGAQTELTARYVTGMLEELAER